MGERLSQLSITASTANKSTVASSLPGGTGCRDAASPPEAGLGLRHLADRWRLGLHASSDGAGGDPGRPPRPLGGHVLPRARTNLPLRACQDLLPPGSRRGGPVARAVESPPPGARKPRHDSFLGHPVDARIRRGPPLQRVDVQAFCQDGVLPPWISLHLHDPRGSMCCHVSAHGLSLATCHRPLADGGCLAQPWG